VKVEAEQIQHQAYSPALTLADLLTTEMRQAIVRLGWSYDGSFLAIGYQSGPIHVWDVKARCVTHELHSKAVAGRFAWSSIAPLLAWVSPAGLRIEDLSTNKPRRVHLPGTSSAVSVCWPPESTRVAFGTHEGRLAVFDARTDAAQQIVSGTSSIEAVLWSPENRLLALTADGSLRSYSIDGQHELALDVQHATSLALSPRDNLIAAGTEEGRICLWTQSHEKVEAGGDFAGHSGAIRHLSFSSDGSLLASKGDDQRVIIWRLSPPGAVAVIKEHPASDDEGLLFWSSAIAFNPSAPLLATSAQTVRLWNIDAELLTPLPVDLVEIEPEVGSKGLGSGRSQSAPISRTEFYARAPESVAGQTFTAKSAESYVVVLRGGVQVKERVHENVLAFFAEQLRSKNASIANPHPIDLLMHEPAPVIFEIKRVGNQHPGRAIREAIGQLFEYRYFIGPRQARMCIVLDASPRDPALIDFVEKELGMLLLWVTENRIQGGPLSCAFFSNLGVQIAECAEPQ
jgi:WD40 repeat protein